MKKALVAGAGGFIGHHLVNFLKEKGYWVRGVDIKEPEYEKSRSDEFYLLDLRYWGNCLEATKGVDEVYQLAADMGGIGYISGNHAEIAKNNILINTHMLEASYQNGVKRYFYSSSACIYPSYRQQSVDVIPLKEEDAMPADPEEGYGWEKLFAEKLCQYYQEDKGIETRIARFHNVYGPLGTYKGGREKAPAAICRKIALAEDSSEIEVWGDGKQTRSFLYIQDCVEGIYLITQSDYPKPLNLGSEELVTIDQLVEMTAKVANKNIRIRHNLSKPQGVRGRNSDNSKLYKITGWRPKFPLLEGLKLTYPWIAERVARERNMQGCQ
ncbi:NAD-dependent dehydratase [Candidatus Methylacidiphilum fumarolicum]|uniref:GDP-mannose 3,5-epimerase n=2 Tax=Candidatus Methylacidiphilum fumarolicum TaxID=591154 RepID=I0K0X9_METFB|nr:NAD-dependent epimerase/dehydratase family protein [Candidatus Methylacidiphilum fumarolicum]MBW6413981.1 NAD-dependent epimerase/dehydratase family protein [Candidatus Methylacidiphilum fumarolicum]TFE70524.1 NAD-dependent dehydratase [Candidatus Methylacidiphilum fumarolicum]TFE74760.1 NAD-dependent dehydratase [Candidatus Methylacidiphilum fumarolicum]TFE76006.1 NAD-dependent dehydratase [Candidatus Methylacidiphilum fumarolicum]TFE76411.1 NAD-dependent dehydratase [Candidatus Methylacid